MTRRHAVRPTPEGEKALRRGSSWLHVDAIGREPLAARAGDLAIVFDARKRFLALGLWDPGSDLRLRVLVRGAPQVVDASWFAARIDEAAKRRRELFNPDFTNGWRVIHGENDGLPGLVVDRFGDTLVVKLYTAAWIPWLETVQEALRCAEPHDRLVLRLSRHVAVDPGPLDGYADGQILTGPPLTGPVFFRENGLTLEADPVNGQKTGHFLDQRDHRLRLCGISRGERVLDVFSCTGGFALAAARGGAREVLAVDISASALLAARRNFERNAAVDAMSQCTLETRTGDAFAVLSALRLERRQFDIVVLDPPGFAQNRTQVTRALEAYARLTKLGLSVLRAGGLLVQFCCSARIHEEEFCRSIIESACAVGRPLHSLIRTGQPADHPVAEGGWAYLKGLWGRTL